MVAVISLPAFGVDYSQIKDLIESNGYIYFPKGSGIKRLDSDSYVLRVFLDTKDGEFKKSVVVHVAGDSVVPIDAPVWAGDSVSIDTLEINADGNVDIVVNEYYEPWFNVRVYFGGVDQTFRKVLDGQSTIMPKIVDVAPFGRTNGGVKEVVLYEDPYGLGGHRDVIVPYLYVFRDGEYVLMDNSCLRSQR